LVHGHDVAALTWISGTHTGPIEGVSGMNQKVGQLGGELVTFDDQGRVTQETDYDDDPTTTNQLVPDPHHPVRPADHMPDVAKETVVAKNDDGEKANVAVVQSLIDAFDKHDAKAMGRAFADDLVWSEQENPKDWTKAETLADAQANWKAFSDMKMTSTALWGAGSYVVLQASMEGTNDAAAPAMGIATATKKHVTLPFFEIDQIANGKIAKAWVVANSGVVPYELGLKPMPAMPATGSAAPGSAGSAK
jgi:ketosteroid isomerase-like protein